MNGNSFVYEIWKLTGVDLIKSPLNAEHNEDNKNGGIAINFLHGWLFWFLKITKIDIAFNYI